MNHFVIQRLPKILLIIFFTLYFGYFSVFSTLRARSLYAHYFDLGIMHQATYNSYMSLRTLDFGRFLEITDPHESVSQVKRMAIHNDVILGLLGIFYFIHSGPETLLVLQSLVVAVGGFFVYGISRHIFKLAYSKWIALSFAVSYFLYPPLQKSLNFDFHAITMSVTFILGIYYFYLKKNYLMQGLCIALTLATKEQIGLVIFGFYTLNILLYLLSQRSIKNLFSKETKFNLIAGITSFFWVVISLLVIIPYYRGGEHFGASYYGHILENPLGVFSYIFNFESYWYMYLLLGPLGFLALLSPLYLLTASSEFGVNILSANANMRNIFFHYDTGLTATIFLASIFGGVILLKILSSTYFVWLKRLVVPEKILIMYILATSGLFSYSISPLPWSLQRDLAPFRGSYEALSYVESWQKTLKDDVKVSSTGRLSPFLASRRYFYDFAGGYYPAEYVFVYTRELNNSFQKDDNQKQYLDLKLDRNFILLEKKAEVEVYKRINNL